MNPATHHSGCRSRIGSISVLALLMAASLGAQSAPDTLRLRRDLSATELGFPSMMILDFGEVRAASAAWPPMSIELRLSDESPEDRMAGAALFLWELVLRVAGSDAVSTRRALVQSDGSETPVLEFAPFIEGGFRKQGYISADGDEIVHVTYDFVGPDYRAISAPLPEQLTAVEVYLLLANDYRVDIYVNGVHSGIMRSAGNVQDGSNQAFVRFVVTSPTAEQPSVVHSAAWGEAKLRQR